jgi:hypothetical protein
LSQFVGIRREVPFREIGENGYEIAETKGIEHDEHIII